MGAPGSQRHEFYCNKIQHKLGEHLYLQSKQVRNFMNDWRFKTLDEIMWHTYRIKDLVESAPRDTVVLNMCCCLREQRLALKPNVIFCVGAKFKRYTAPGEIGYAFSNPLADEASIIKIIGADSF